MGPSKPCEIRGAPLCWSTMTVARWFRGSLLVLVVAPAPGVAACKAAPAGTPTPVSEPTVSEPVAAVEPVPVVEPVAASSTEPAAATSAAAKGESYLACGCGCCGGPGEVPPEKKCLDRKNGETLAKVKAMDEKSRKDPQCAMMGCSRGTEYSYCDG